MQLHYAKKHDGREDEGTEEWIIVLQVLAGADSHSVDNDGVIASPPLSGSH